MNRRHHSDGTHSPGACQGRIFGRFFVGGMMVIAILMVIWTLFLASAWVDSMPVDSKASPRMVEQMIWNPSPK